LEEAVALRPFVLAILLASSVSACKSDPPPDPVEEAAKRKRDLESARIRLRDGKVGEAEALFQSVLAGEPQNPLALHGLGRVHLERKAYPEACDLIAKAIAADPAPAEFHASLGDCNFYQEKHAEAAAAYGQAFKLAPDDGDIGLKHGRALRAIKKLDEAEAVLRQVAEVDRKTRFVLGELGDVLREQGRLDEALTTYMKAQIENPDDKMSYAGAALAYEAKGDPKHALDQWSTFIRMDCCSEYSKNVAREKMISLGGG
jgi:tetratricopeptide (TPR) repeat protein